MRDSLQTLLWSATCYRHRPGANAGSLLNEVNRCVLQTRGSKQES